MLLEESCICCDLDGLDVTPQHEYLLNRLEGVCEGDNSEYEHKDESGHVEDALSDHTHQPAEHHCEAKIEHEAEPDDNGCPTLHIPELGVLSIVLKDIDGNKYWCHEVQQSCRSLEICNEVFKDDTTLNTNQVDRGEDQQEPANVVLSLKIVTRIVKIWQDQV